MHRLTDHQTHKHLGLVLIDVNTHRCVVSAKLHHKETNGQTPGIEFWVQLSLKMRHLVAIFGSIPDFYPRPLPLPQKAKAYNTCIVPQVAYCNCRGAGHDTKRAGIRPIGGRQSLRPQADL